MFDFEKLEVYKLAKLFNSRVRNLIANTDLDRGTKDQLRRAAFSVMLNLAEGSGRFSKADRKHFYIISRSSVFECVAILDFLHEGSNIPTDIFHSLYDEAETLSKILFSMIRNLSKKSE